MAVSSRRLAYLIHSRHRKLTPKFPDDAGTRANYRFAPQRAPAVSIANIIRKFLVCGLSKLAEASGLAIPGDAAKQIDQIAKAKFQPVAVELLWSSLKLDPAHNCGHVTFGLPFRTGVEQSICSRCGRRLGRGLRGTCSASPAWGQPNRSFIFAAGNAIPLPARIMQVGDVYDALRSQRPYKKAVDHGCAVEVIMRGDGRTQPEHFDPEVLAAFAGIAHRFAAIYDQPA